MSGQPSFYDIEFAPQRSTPGEVRFLPVSPNKRPSSTALCVHSPDARTRLLLRPCGLSPGTRRPVPWGPPWAGEDAAACLLLSCNVKLVCSSSSRTELRCCRFEDALSIFRSLLSVWSSCLAPGTTLWIPVKLMCLPTLAGRKRGLLDPVRCPRGCLVLPWPFVSREFHKGHEACQHTPPVSTRNLVKIIQYFASRWQCVKISDYVVIIIV